MLYGKGRGNIESVVYGIVPQPCRKARINGDLDVEAIPWRAAWVVEEEGKDRRDGSWIASDIAGRQRQVDPLSNTGEAVEDRQACAGGTVSRTACVLSSTLNRLIAALPVSSAIAMAVFGAEFQVFASIGRAAADFG